MKPVRAEGQAILDRLATEYAGRRGIDRAPMFGSVGLRFGEKFFAFVGRDGALVVKVPEALAGELVASGRAVAIKAGRNATREWVGLPIPADGRTDEWAALLAEAYAYAAGASA
jgi:TfoX/Sxy family transcriptional regulator of competence genes